MIKKSFEKRLPLQRNFLQVFRCSSFFRLFTGIELFFSGGTACRSNHRASLTPTTTTNFIRSICIRIVSCYRIHRLQAAARTHAETIQIVNQFTSHSSIDFVSDLVGRDRRIDESLTGQFLKPRSSSWSGSIPRSLLFIRASFKNVKQLPSTL